MGVSRLEVVAAGLAVVLAIVTVRQRRSDAFEVVGIVTGGLLMLLGRALAPTGTATRDTLGLLGAAIMLVSFLRAFPWRAKRP